MATLPKYPYIDPNNPNQILPVIQNGQQGQPGAVNQPSQAVNPVTNVGGGQPGQTMPGVNVAQNVAGAPQINPNTVQGLGSGYTPGQAGGANADVLSTAQQKVIQGMQSPLGEQLSTAAQNLLASPGMGFDQQNYVTQSMDKFNRERNAALEAYRQQQGSVSNTGQYDADLRRRLLEGAQVGADQERMLQDEARDKQIQYMLDAIKTGSDIYGQQADIWSQGIQDLATVRGAAEGEENRMFQGAESAIDRGLQIATTNQNAELQGYLTELKGKIDLNQLLTTQDFDAAQSSLDRELDRYVAEGNWQNASEIVKLKGELDQIAADKQREWQTAERQSTQVWSTGERVDAQQHERNLQYFDQQNRLAMQNNDIQAQKDLQENEWQYKFQYQTQEMSHEAKMAQLNAELQDALANNDVTRQKTIMSYGAEIEFERMAKEYGYDSAMANLQGKIQDALNSNDWTRRDALETKRMQLEAEQFMLNYNLNKTRVALEEKGLEWQRVEAAYQNVKNLSDTGVISADAPIQFMNSVLSDNGISMNLSPVDQTEAAKKAIEANYDAEKYQFGLSHPELVYTDTVEGTPTYATNASGQRVEIPHEGHTAGELTPEGEAAFTEWYNSNTYQDNTQTISEILAESDSLIGSADPGSANYLQYRQLVDESPSFGASVSLENPRGAGNNYYTFDDTVPPVGTTFTMNGALYKTVAGVSRVEETPRDYESFIALNVNDGKQYYVNSRDGSINVVPVL